MVILEAALTVILGEAALTEIDLMYAKFADALGSGICIPGI